MLGSRCREMVVSWYTGRLWVVVKEKKKRNPSSSSQPGLEEKRVFHKGMRVYHPEKKKTKGIIIEKLSVW